MNIKHRFPVIFDIISAPCSEKPDNQGSDEYNSSKCFIHWKNSINCPILSQLIIKSALFLASQVIDNLSVLLMTETKFNLISPTNQFLLNGYICKLDRYLKCGGIPFFLREYFISLKNQLK